MYGKIWQIQIALSLRNRDKSSIMLDIVPHSSFPGGNCICASTIAHRMQQRAFKSLREVESNFK